MKEILKKYSIFFTPSGAGIAIICFFLPWVKVSCGAITIQASGARIGGPLWLVLVSAVLILGTFIYFYVWRRKNLLKAKMITLTGAIAAVIIMLYKFIFAFAGGGEVKFSEMGSVLRIGAFGEFFGFMLAIIGSIIMKEENQPQTKDRAYGGSRLSKRRRRISLM
jgi:magnesium-transporting ATPase (P-type)